MKFTYKVTVKPGMVVKIAGIPLTMGNTIELYTNTDITKFGASPDYDVERASYDVDVPEMEKE